MTASGEPETPDTGDTDTGTGTGTGDTGPAESGPGDDTTLTVEDIGGLNCQMVLRAAVFARLAGTVVASSGVAGLMAWGWVAVRVQQRAAGEATIDPLASDMTTGDVALVERVDLFTAQIPVGVIAVLAVGVGLGLRLVADYTVARTGGSLTGYEPGDRV